jgi:RHS repeat-associated protein
VRLDATGSPTYYVPDALGSVGVTIDAAGTVTDARLTNAWGEDLRPPGQDRHGYTLRERMAEIAILDGTSAMHYRARTYFPEMGRFSQSDQNVQMGDKNAYIYASDRPSVFVDPLGLQEAASNARRSVDSILPPTERTISIKVVATRKAALTEKDRHNARSSILEGMAFWEWASRGRLKLAWNKDISIMDAGGDAYDPFKVWGAVRTGENDNQVPEDDQLKPLLKYLGKIGIHPGKPGFGDKVILIVEDIRAIARTPRDPDAAGFGDALSSLIVVEKASLAPKGASFGSDVIAHELWHLFSRQGNRDAGIAAEDSMKRNFAIADQDLQASMDFLYNKSTLWVSKDENARDFRASWKQLGEEYGNYTNWRTSHIKEVEARMP